MTRTSLVAAAIALSLAAAAAPASAAYINVWSTTFDTGEYENVGPFPLVSLTTQYRGATFDSAGTAPGLGTRFFHNDTAGMTRFIASGLGTHSSLKLSFDLIFVDSWDSTNGTPSPDYIDVNVDGVIGTYTSATQSGTIFEFGPGTQTAFGFFLGNPAFADRIVHYDFTVPHTASSFFLALNAYGAGFQYGSDESWGIDNFALSAEATRTIPEPAAWTMLITGFGLVGTAARRRRLAA